ncbi:hypothetical protein [Gordonia sp. (in: high G+C Gram-positive bacteria)]|uniref:hypothetical protein n=1 Tax=Gordonia sp. (in: high G+C Gram-positive bacteria) TaxID=84139 RepID=UPI001D629AD4|nr:hypothetical protein [Gordonia sp. (in: high G+C Gram-positive bacteria)]MCB1294445.1 hypothetical protein [Gordonia sp. (in: high G+C Gram-positive bacteria)]HMS77713.1 hypothetical protein [Gordonia sp. (in: high G+C Gram-positive bacteria)]
MDTGWAGLGLIAAAVAVVAYVHYRDRETARLGTGAELARELRSLSGGDPVRIAAVEEYETTIYQRLFYASVIGPRVRAAAWALLGAALAAFGALVTDPVDSAFATVVTIALIVVAAVFGLAALVLAAIAGYQAATTPRVSFADSYAEGP